MEVRAVGDGDREWLRVLATGVATTHIAGLISGQVLPWTGSLTMVAFLLLALTRKTLRAGVASLTVLALLVDCRSGGAGFPNALLDGPSVPEAVLLGVGLVALAVGARWYKAGLLAVALLALGVAPVVWAAVRPEPETAVVMEQPRVEERVREELLARARAQEREGVAVVIAVARVPGPEVQAAPDWSLGLLPAGPAALLFVVLALLSAGREAEEDGLA